MGGQNMVRTKQILKILLLSASMAGLLTHSSHAQVAGETIQKVADKAAEKRAAAGNNHDSEE